MRLGQIARKLSISPSEILGYLATRNIIIEENANSRLDTEHLRLILQKFAPDQLTILDTPLAITPIVDSAPEQPVQVLGVSNTEVANAEPSNNDLEPASLTAVESPFLNEQPSTTLVEMNDVIKAPKIALSGLKVLGKIELPEPKKKEQDTPTGVDESVPTDTQPRKSFQPRKQSREQRPYKNPVTLQREREMKEELEKRQQKAEQEKERKTQNYLKKVKMSPPTKAVRMVDEPLEQMTHEELKEEPKSWFRKIIKWLST